MNYFGEFNRKYRLYAGYRFLRLVLVRRIGGFVIKCAGWIEALVSGLRRGGGRRVLPDFFIIGAQKSGTSSLTCWLNQLPEFSLAMMRNPRKTTLRMEIRFFSDPRVRTRGLEWYSSKFIPGKINGEKCPEYLPRKNSLQELYRCCPGAKLIVMLRNPVSRAFSAYQHYSKNGKRRRYWDWLLPDRSFEENLRAEEFTGFPIGILSRGRYAEQLEDLFGIFPEEQVKIIVFERFVKEPGKSLEEIVRFLGGSTDSLDIKYLNANPGRYDSALCGHTRRQLADYYRPYNEKLFKRLGYRIEEWEEE